MIKDLQIYFYMLTCFGFWKPFLWTNKWHGQVYSCLRIFLIILPYWLAFGQITRILFDTTNIDEITETLFILLTTINVCLRGANFLLRHKEIIDLMELLSMEWAKPQNTEELHIYNTCNSIIRMVGMTIFTLGESTLLAGLIVPIFKDQDQNPLPAQVWLPYNYSVSHATYWSTYIMNSFCAISIANLSVAMDVITFGILLISGCLIDFLDNRLVNLGKNMKSHKAKELGSSSQMDQEKKLMAQIIQNHVFIYEFADKNVDIFSLSICSQFVMSSIGISVSVYQLSTDVSNNAEFYMKLLYLCTVITQLYLFCWFGNELTLKSEKLGQSVFQSNWISLNSKSIENLLLISIRSSKPIIISCGSCIAFRLDTFNNIIKVSYTAFNVLRDST